MELVQVLLPPGHRFPMECLSFAPVILTYTSQRTPLKQKYRRTRQLLQEDPQCAEKILFVPGPQGSKQSAIQEHPFTACLPVPLRPVLKTCC
eukprot:1159861-Pelagomonas_calceolata.AAC.3